MHERILLTQTMHPLASKKHPREKEFLDAFNKALISVKEFSVYRDVLNEYVFYPCVCFKAEPAWFQPY